MIRRYTIIVSSSLLGKLGLLIADENGLPVQASLNLKADIGWVGYAKEAHGSNVETL
jgi:hypothetical protein